MFGVIAPLSAQVPEVARPLQIVRTASTHLHPLPPIPGGFVHDPFLRTHHIVTTVNNTERLVTKTVVNPSIPHSTAPVTAARMQRSWMEQMQRDWKARQLKKQHAESVALAQARASLPKPVESEAFFTHSLEAVSPDKTIRAERIALPTLKEPGFLYRGLALDAEGTSIANILENGLRVQDAGDESTTLITAYASHSQVPSHIIATANKKVTNLTDNPQSAVYWLYKRLTPELQVPVLVRVSGRTETGSLVVETKDIPADQLTVFAKLKINNQARWCQIKRAVDENGQAGFKITPFEHVLKAE